MLRQAGVSGHAYPVGVHQPRLLVHPWPRSLLPRLQLLNFNMKRAGRVREGRGGKKKGENILGNSSGFLCVSLSPPDTPPFSLVRFSGFGRRETDKPSLSLSLSLSALALSLGVSPSWFRWNLIWIAAFGFGHSCTATVGKKEKKNRIEH